MTLVIDAGLSAESLRDLIEFDGPGAAFTVAAFEIESAKVPVPAEIVEAVRRIADEFGLWEELESLESAPVG